MKKNPEALYKQLKIVTSSVKQDLRLKGIVIPTKNANGSITVGNYTIVKKHAFYSIVNHSGNNVVDQINLPQTAALIANGLALGKPLDKSLLVVDQQYGYAEFEELLHAQIATQNLKRNFDRAELMLTKSLINRLKKEQHKKVIMKNFEKLKQFA